MRETKREWERWNKLLNAHASKVISMHLGTPTSLSGTVHGAFATRIKFQQAMFVNSMTGSTPIWLRSSLSVERLKVRRINRNPKLKVWPSFYSSYFPCCPKVQFWENPRVLAGLKSLIFTLCETLVKKIKAIHHRCWRGEKLTDTQIDLLLHLAQVRELKESWHVPWIALNHIIFISVV